MDRLTKLENRLTKLEDRLNINKKSINEDLAETAAAGAEDAIQKEIARKAPDIAKLGIENIKKFLDGLKELFKDKTDKVEAIDEMIAEITVEPKK